MLSSLPIRRRALLLFLTVVGSSFVLTTRDSFARTCTWNAGSGGTGGGNWSTAAAWSCGTGGTGPPAAADSVVFNSTSIRPCAIDIAASVTSISVNSGYTGTVTQGSGITVRTSGAFTQAAGTFTGGNTQVYVGGAFNLSAGAFTATSSMLDVAGAFNMTGTGTFTHNSGLVMLSSPSSQTFATNGATFNNLIMNDGLVGYWNMDDNTGSTIADQSGNQNDGTLFNGPTWVTGSANLPTTSFSDTAAVNFDGTNDYATLGVNNMGTLDSPKTIAAWAYWTSVPAASADVVTLKNVGTGGIIQLGFNGSSGLIKVWKGGSNFLVASASTPASGWHHLAYTWDGTTNSLYIDGGTPATSTALAPAIDVIDTAYLSTRNAAAELWSGRIDDVRIYDRALSSAQVAALAAGSGPSTAVQTVTGNPTVAGDLRISSGTLAAGNTSISVANSWLNYGGTFTTGTSGTVTFNGTTAGKTITNNGSAFNHLIIGGGGSGAWQLSDSPTTVGGNLSITGGTLISTSGTLEIQGAFNKTGGTFTHNSGTVLLSSTSNQTFATNGTTFNNLTINDGLAAYWKLDDTASPSVDSSGAGRDATWSSTPSASTTVPTVNFYDGKSLSIDSAADYASFTSPDAPIISVAGWVKATAAGGGAYQRILDMPGYTIFINAATQVAPDNPMALALTSNRSTTAGQWKTPSNSIVYGTWYHIALTYDSSNVSNAPLLYLNGVAQTVTNQNACVGTAISNVGTGYIGNNAAGTRYFNGLIDDLRIYNRILSTGEITALAAGNRPAGIATHTLSGNLNVAGTLTITSGTLATSSYTVSVTGAASVTSGGLTVGSNTVTLTGGLDQQAQGTVTQNTAGGHIVLGAGQTSTYSDTAGTIQGFPTAAFNWSTFAYWNTYVAFRDYNGTTDRLYARSADGAPRYYWDLPASVGNLLGTPRWNMEGAIHYVYLVTTLGRVYKLSDDGTAFTVVSGWPYFNGGSATATSPLVSDSNNLYWCGNDSASARQMFSLALATKVLNGTSALVGDVLAAPALATVSSINYLYTVTSGKVYRTPVTLAAGITSTQPTTTVNGRISVLAGKVLFAEDNGKVWALSATDLSTTWSYQDTNTTNHPGGCSAGNQCSVANVYYDNSLSRTYFGDKDGHFYVLGSTGAAITGYPWRPGLSTDSFLTAPLYRSGVIVVGSSSGKVFVVDQNNGTGPALIRTYNLGSAISSISYNSTTGTSGGYAVATANGSLYYLPNEADPTSGSI